MVLKIVHCSFFEQLVYRPFRGLFFECRFRAMLQRLIYVRLVGTSVWLDFCAAVFGAVEVLGLVATTIVPLDTVFVLQSDFYWLWWFSFRGVVAFTAHFVAGRVGSVFFVALGIRVFPFIWRNIPFMLN